MPSRFTASDSIAPAAKSAICEGTRGGKDRFSKINLGGREIFMRIGASGIANRSLLRIATAAGASLLLALLIGGAPFESDEAIALTQAGIAAHNGEADLTRCSKNTGTALYGCVADVLKNACYRLGRSAIPPAVKQPFDSAIYRLRRAVDKVQALSALAQARAAISGALQQARSIGHVEGGTADTQDLAAISALIGHAIQLIQSKG